ncbi:hypothetical protein [Streptomyces sp. NPDC086777]
MARPGRGPVLLTEPQIRAETHGLDVIGDADRKGTPRALCRP